jgi:hypothetical protein
MNNMDHPSRPHTPMQSSSLADRLAADLVPVRRLSPRQGMALVALASALLVTAVAAIFGLRADMMNAQPAGIVLLRAGVLLILGSAAVLGAIDLARPMVGRSGSRGALASGWMGPLAVAMLFPVLAIVASVDQGGYPMADLMAVTAPWCLGISSTCALIIGSALTWWMRQGAVVRLDHAGWMVGLGSGALGTMIYSLHCPSTSITYIGLWYSLAVLLCTLAGRLVVPRLLRW